MKHLHIVPLLEQPQWLPQLARWQQAQWERYSTTGSVEKRQQKLEEHLSEEQLPITFVAFFPATAGEHACPVGCVSLVTYRFSAVGAQSPWLANLLVEPEFRRKGIGSRLLDFAVSHARQLGLSKLFLFTHDQREFYEARGWRWLRQQLFKGEEVDIMVYQF